MGSIGARVSRASIKKEIGELVSKDRITCSGALFYARNTKRILFIQKSNGKHQGTWGVVGGTAEDQETPWQSLQREIQEEIGTLPNILKTIPIETFVSNDKVFNFHTYLCIVDEEFIPQLSLEHTAWCWAPMDLAPKPLHQGLRNSFNNRTVRTKLETIFQILDLI